MACRWLGASFRWSVASKDVSKLIHAQQRVIGAHVFITDDVASQRGSGGIQHVLASIRSSLLLEPSTPLIGGVISSLRQTRLHDDVPNVFIGIVTSPNPNDTVSVFHIPATSSDRRFKSVGRWPRQDQDENIEPNWAAKAKPWETWSSVTEKPSKINVNGSPGAMLLISDADPYSSLEQLDNQFSTVPKYGIIGSWTPFVTGQPFTLFYKDQLLDNGVVGMTLPDIKTDCDTSYDSVLDLGKEMTVTKCQGNVILTLDNKPALEFLQKLSNINKQTDYYVRYLPKSSTTDQEQLVKIYGGDPVTGHLAVDKLDQPCSKGDVVQFVCLENDAQFPKFLLKDTCLLSENGVLYPRQVDNHHYRTLVANTPGFNLTLSTS